MIFGNEIIKENNNTSLEDIYQFIIESVKEEQEFFMECIIYDFKEVKCLREEVECINEGLIDTAKKYIQKFIKFIKDMFNKMISFIKKKFKATKDKCEKVVKDDEGNNNNGEEIKVTGPVKSTVAKYKENPCRDTKQSICTALFGILMSDRRIEDGCLELNLKYIKDNGININEPFDNKEPLISKEKSEYTRKDFTNAAINLTHNWCPERLADVKKIARAVYKRRRNSNYDGKDIYIDYYDFSITEELDFFADSNSFFVSASIQSLSNNSADDKTDEFIDKENNRLKDEVKKFKDKIEDKMKSPVNKKLNTSDTDSIVKHIKSTCDDSKLDKIKKEMFDEIDEELKKLKDLDKDVNSDKKVACLLRFLNNSKQSMNEAFKFYLTNLNKYMQVQDKALDEIKNA